MFSTTWHAQKILVKVSEVKFIYFADISFVTFATLQAFATSRKGESENNEKRASIIVLTHLPSYSISISWLICSKKNMIHGKSN